MSQTYGIFCIRTDGRSLIGIPFCVEVSLTSNSAIFFKTVVKEAQYIHEGAAGFPQLSVAICKLWKLKKPLSSEDIRNESKLKVVTILNNSLSQAMQIESSPVKISKYLNPVLLAAYPDDFHILLQVPQKKTTFQRSQGNEQYVMSWLTILDFGVSLSLSFTSLVSFACYGSSLAGPRIVRTKDMVYECEE